MADPTDEKLKASEDSEALDEKRRKAPVAAEDRDADDSDVRGADESAEGTEAQDGEDGDESSEPLAPRNREERRAAARRERRGLPPTQPGATARPRDVAPGRVKLPPKTATGNSSSEEVPPWARSMGDRLGKNRGTIIACVIAAVLGVGGAIGWMRLKASRNATAATAYATALDTVLTPVLPSELPLDLLPAQMKMHTIYHTAAERNKQALVEIQKVTGQYTDFKISPVAQLTEAYVLLEAGKLDEAKTKFQALRGKPLAGLDGRVIEGLAAVLEAQNDLPGAIAQYEEMGRLPERGWHDLALYHQARLAATQNDNKKARDLLASLIEGLNNVAADDVSSLGKQSSVYTRAQALLKDVAPDDPLVQKAASSEPIELTH